MLRSPLFPLLLFLFLVTMARPASPFIIRPNRPAPRPNTRRITPVQQASAGAAEARAGDFNSNVEVLRASLRLLCTHEQQKERDWEDALIDAGRELALARMMAQICDTRLALLGPYV